MKQITFNILAMLCGLLIIQPNSFSQSSCGGFKTYTQGAWGTNCNGGNAGCYRDQNFSTVFPLPAGLTIGCDGGYTLRLETTSAFVNYLPGKKGTANVLDQNYVNPTSTNAGVLASQLVALTLNVGFDEYDNNFAPSTTLLKNQIINFPGSPFNGITVGDFLAIANNLVGGCSSDYTPTQVNEVASALNENYDNGTDDKGYLICPILKIALKGTNNPCAFGDAGSINLSVLEGTAPFTYLWSNNLTTEDILNLSSGIYTVTVTDALGLTATETIEITEPAALSTSLTSVNLTCYKSNNGSINLSAEGGVAPYSIIWSNGSDSENLYNLPADIYTLTLTDANGCVTHDTTIITEPEVLSITEEHKNLTCYHSNDGSIDLTVNGGIAPYNFNWSNSSNSGNNDSELLDLVEIEVREFPSAKNLNSLSAGSYSTTIIDAKGCLAVALVTITEPALLSATLSKSDISCYGKADGSISLTVTGGTPEYAYSWSNNSTTQSISGLTAGTYSVTVTDINLCTASATATIIEPAALSLTLNASNPTCYQGTDGSIAANVTGGTLEYTYNWNTVPSQNTSIASNLGEGTYTVTVVDAHGCSIIKSANLITPPAAGFLTYTQGGWGATPTQNGNNPGNKLAQNFSFVFPNGIKVGSNNRFLAFTNAPAIDAFLPSGGTSAVLPQGTQINPTSKYKNTFAGQVVALTITVAFDSYLPDFAPAQGSIGDLVIGSGQFKGLTVNDILALSNKALGGINTGYSLSALNGIADSLNQNFDNGTNKGLLFNSCEERAGKFGILNEETSINTSSSLTTYPNPFADNTKIEFTLTYDSPVSVEIYNFSGELVITVFKGNVNASVKNQLDFNGSNVEAGVYYCKLTTNQGTTVSKLVVAK